MGGSGDSGCFFNRSADDERVNRCEQALYLKTGLQSRCRMPKKPLFTVKKPFFTLQKATFIVRKMSDRAAFRLRRLLQLRNVKTGAEACP
jgi:hypothetical protein